AAELPPDLLDRFLCIPVFAVAPDGLSREAVGECLQRVWLRFPRYFEFVARTRRVAGAPEGPPAVFLPVLKRYPFDLPRGFAVVRALTSSGTTGRPSVTPLHQHSCDRPLLALP